MCRAIHLYVDEMMSPWCRDPQRHCLESLSHQQALDSFHAGLSAYRPYYCVLNPDTGYEELIHQNGGGTVLSTRRSPMPPTQLHIHVRAWLSGESKCFVRSAQSRQTLFHLRDDINAAFGKLHDAPLQLLLGDTCLEPIPISLSHRPLVDLLLDYPQSNKVFLRVVWLPGLLSPHMWTDEDNSRPHNSTLMATSNDLA